MVRLIGDVHGNYQKYLKLIEDVEFSIQLGDFGFDYSCLDGISDNHKIVAGNHDNYDRMDDSHFLGDYGTYEIEEQNFSCFFIRGGFSVDKAFRTEGISWWKNEELTYQEMEKCVDLYSQAKPKIVISHECPSEIGQMICDGSYSPSKTSQLLNVLWNIHSPKIWVFAHWHKDWECFCRDTQFYCLDELSCFET